MPHLLLPHLLMGALSWDPQIRGMLILITAIAILPGSVYLLLATNVGARLGFLLAVAGLSGWMMLLGVTWAFYGQGIKGRDPSWKVREVIHTRAPEDLSGGTLKTLDDFPTGWNKLPTSGSAILGDAQAAADNFITKSGRKPKIGPEGPIIKDPTAEMLRFPAEFSESSDYVVTAGYNKGGDNELFSINRHKFYFRHSAHYVAVELRPVFAQPVSADGVPPKPIPDTTKQLTTVIVERDLGSVRFPQVMMAIASGIIFAVTCHALHRRDKQLMAIRTAGRPTPATA